MNPQTVRAVLAYVMTLMVAASAVGLGWIVAHPADFTTTQATLLGTIIGGIMTKWGTPLGYFFDGVAGGTFPKPAAPTATVKD